MKNILILISTFCLSQEAFDGMCIFTPGGMGAGNNNISTLLLDNDNNTIHSWSHTRGAASMPYLSPDSSIIYPYRVPEPTMTNGGVGGGIQKISWDGTIIWDYVISNENYQHHHDIEPLPNGNILVIAWERKYPEEAYALGRIEGSINNQLDEMWSETIFELQPIDYNNFEIVWEWHFWDHLVQYVDSNLANYGNIPDHPELFDINLGSVGNSGNQGNTHADWIHINAIAYNEELDQIIFSSASQDEFFIIDHSTTIAEASSHSGGNSGLGGDFLYRWGNPQNYGRGNASNKFLEHQHGVNWIPSDSPGGGHIILFNNGPNNSNSEILEVQLPINSEGTYDIEDNAPFGPVIPFWSYVGNFHSQMQGGAFRLPNGNTFITVAEFAHILEINTNGNIVWEYTYPGENIIIARAQKYGINYLNNILFGDLNQDGAINVLDILLAVTLILDDEYIEVADINLDGFINIIDIIQMINIILS